MPGSGADASAKLQARISRRLAPLLRDRPTYVPAPSDGGKAPRIDMLALAWRRAVAPLTQGDTGGTGSAGRGDGGTRGRGMS